MGFFGEMDWEKVREQAGEALRGADDGEVFFEDSFSESLVLDDGRLRNSSFETAKGFGLRAVSGESVGYGHADDVTHEALGRASGAARQVIRGGRSGAFSQEPRGTNKGFYGEGNPLEGVAFEARVGMLKELDSYARRKDERVRQVTASLSCVWQRVAIVRPDGEIKRDIRPLVRLSVQVMAERGGRRETGMSGGGGRRSVEGLLDESFWKRETDEAIRQACVNLESAASPAGEMDVVLGPGWPGILLHEAVGHGLEGDFHQKKTSAFTGLEGERVAARGVTIVDDATLAGRRGSLTMDDEGTPGRRTVLIEDGILKGCLHDRKSARLMGVEATGNGRRESYRSLPMPRMTNTFMLNGEHEQEEMIRSVKKGIYAPFFGGGQVDITSGKFVFSCTEAYEIENGKIGRSLKGAMLIGNGPDVLKRVKMIGNDMALDSGIGTCGKEGQSVPVGVGQPSLLISGLTVGGTQTGA